MAIERKRFLVPIQGLLITAGLLMVLLVGGSIGILGFTGMNGALRAAMEQQFDDLILLMQERERRLIQPVEIQLGILMHDRVVSAETVEERLESLPILAQSLRMSETVKSVYIGYPNGEFFMVRRVDQPQIASRFQAPEGAQFLVQSITRETDGAMVGAYRFFDDGLRNIETRPMPSYRYDPRTRPWYEASAQSFDSRISDPYVFYTTQEIGITVSRKEPGGRAILGMDATIAQLAAEVGSMQITEGSEVALLQESGKLIAYPDLTRIIRPGTDGTIERVHIDDLGVPALLKAYRHFEETGETEGTIQADGREWLFSRTTLDIGSSSGSSLLLAVPLDELFAASHVIIQEQGVVILVILALAFPVGLILVRQFTRPLKVLAGDVKELAAFEFDDPVVVKTRVLEVVDLAETVEDLRITIGRFQEINRAIAGEEDFDTLIERLLDEIIATTKTEAGVLYLLDADETTLEAQAARLDDRTDLTLQPKPVPLSDKTSLLVRSIQDEAADGAIATEGELAACGLAGVGDEMPEPPRHLLAAPLFNRQKELVGVLLLLETDEMDPALVRFTEALSGSAAVSVEARQLIDMQKELFESFIEMIAGAIDAKSPYTGGHCERVPELTEMLATAADQAKTGPFADFTLSEDDREAVHVAAWLHDCGKVTTPEYVVDKATKLETIYDRIHEIRMRIEVMKRDAELSYYKDALRTGETPEAKAALQQVLVELDEDFHFLAACNQGGEFMSEDHIARVKSLASKTWTRTLDNRLGLSHEELARLEKEPPVPVPAQEPLLADRVDHLFDRPDAEKIPADNPWGFKLDVPEHLYNRGEVHNLCIRRGTLTEEDRYKINEHIVQTIKMLERLPFPKHLRAVPELAGGHHEKMDGTGYPRKLTSDDMSPVARMMAVADVFEALTAVDRPYKKGKTLSQALKIMTFLVKDKHLDPELFDLFLTSGVYRDYAEKFLKPDQIDDVDPEEFRL